MTSEILSRDEARRQGLKRFYPGAPCSRGHDSERNVSDGKCVECHAEWKHHNYHARKRRAEEAQRAQLPHAVQTLFGTCPPVGWRRYRTGRIIEVQGVAV
jgi:hypothetical protein